MRRVILALARPFPRTAAPGWAARDASWAAWRGLLILLATLPVRLGAGQHHAALADELFSGKQIPHLAIEISAENMGILRGAERYLGSDSSRPGVMATVREGQTVYTNVALHLKGSRGSFRPVDAKPAFTLHFNKQVEGQRFHGLQKISLNNSVQDATYLCEQLGRGMFSAAGVPVPRVTHATVELNGRPLGVFVLLEGWNKEFLKHHFRDAGGNFYEPDPSTDITGHLEVKSGDHPEDRSALGRLAAAAWEPDRQKRWTALERTLDIDRFITSMALETLLGHWDSYSGNRNNYRIFHDRLTDRLVFLPHGMDQLFGLRRSRRRDQSILPPMQGYVAAAILETDEGRRRYLARMAELHAKVFNVAAMTNQVRQVSARLHPLLTNDLETLTYHDETVARLLERLPQRYETVRDQLAAMSSENRSSNFETNTAAGKSSDALINQPAGPRRLNQKRLQQAN